MKGLTRLVLWFFLVSFFVITACDRWSKQPDLSKLGPSSAATTTVLPFGSPNCPIGGLRIDTGADANGNGALDATEVVHAVPVCYDPGATGKSYGYTTLVKIESEPTGTVHCAAGGLKILSGIDTNRSGVLDASEITYTEYVCNGAPAAGGTGGITVAVNPPEMPAVKAGGKKKQTKASPSKTAKAASDAPVRKNGKAGAKAASQKIAVEQDAQEEPAAAPKKDNARPKASSKTPKAAPAASAGPQGWINVNVSAPQLAKVAYKIDGRYIIVRFTNLSKTSSVRFKYTVKWKAGQNSTWVDDSTMEGISFRLKPLDVLDREIPTRAQEVKDVVVELDISEAAGAS